MIFFLTLKVILNKRNVPLMVVLSETRMRWPKYWSFSFSTIPSKEIPGLGNHKLNGIAGEWNTRVVSGKWCERLQYYTKGPLSYSGVKEQSN